MVDALGFAPQSEDHVKKRYLDIKRYFAEDGPHKMAYKSVSCNKYSTMLRDGSVPCPDQNHGPVWWSGSEPTLVRIIPTHEVFYSGF